MATLRKIALVVSALVLGGLILLEGAACGRPLYLWAKTVDQLSDSAFTAVTCLPDGNYLAAGAATVNGDSEQDFMACYDNQGNQLWVKDFNTPDNFFVSGVSITTNGGAVLVGKKQGVPTFAMCDENGSQKWLGDTKSIFTNLSTAVGSSFDSVVSLSDGNYVAVGYLNTNAEKNYEYGIVVAFSPTGKILWSKKFGDGLNVVELDEVTTSNDGNVLMSGWTKDYRGCVIELSPTGKMLWSNEEVSGVGTYYRITQCHEGGCLALCTLDDEHTTLERYDANGKRLWEHTISEKEIDYPQGALEEPDQTFILYGAIKADHLDESPTDDYVAHLDANGNLLADAVPLGSDSEPSDVIMTPDNALIICGNVGGYTSPIANILKFDLSQLH